MKMNNPFVKKYIYIAMFVLLLGESFWILFAEKM